MPARSHYRAHLDGLRFVAVYLVVAFHAGLAGFAGGFIGVDVFFVLSGYLVTGILLRDLVSSRRIDFRRFYSRRFRRILPAAALTLLVVAVVYSRVVSPSEMLDVVGGFKAAFLFVANWFFLRQSVDYFATSVDKSPVLHFWSLAVEEQFYLVWPLLFGGLLFATARLGRMRWWALRAVVAVAGLASLIAALHIAHGNLNRAYYGTDTRAYQLLAGALIALTPQLMRLPRRLAGAMRAAVPVALVALVYVGSSVVHFGPISRGLAAVVLTSALIVGLENWRSGPVGRALSTPWVAYLGRVSFATYLWHWPVVVIATHSRHISPVPLFVLTAVLSTLLAIGSYHLVEQPVRGSAVLDRYRVPVIATGLAVSVVGGLVVLPAIARRDSGATAGAIGSSGTPVTLDWQAAKKDIPDLPDCLGTSLAGCTPVSGTGKRLLLAGDSHARMWIPAFEDIARARSMTLVLAILPDCPWQRGLNYFHGVKYKNVNCEKHQDDLYDRILPEFDPNIVVVVHQGYDDAVVSRPMLAVGGKHIAPGDADYETDLVDASRASLDAMRAPDRKVVILEPIPMAPLSYDPLSCISSGGQLSRCDYRAGTSPTPLERFYRSAANGTSVISIDADRLACPDLPVCHAVVNGLIVKRDPSHLTATYARSVAPQLNALLQKGGVFAGP